MATLTPERVTVSIPPDIAGDEDAMQQLRDGLANAESVTAKESFAALDDEHPSYFVWEELVDAAIKGIAPQVAQMLEDAIADRLPWTWEPER